MPAAILIFFNNAPPPTYPHHTLHAPSPIQQPHPVATPMSLGVSRSLSVDLGRGFVKSLKKRSVYCLFRVDQQIARTDSEDENSDSHSRSTIVGANISLSVIHYPSIRIHFNFIAYNCSFDYLFALFVLS
jgi:hypothetical protein